MGAIDSKHVRIVKPSNTGSQHFNYNKFFSMHLMAFGKRRRKKDSNDSKPGRGSGGKGGASRKSRADKMAQKKSAKSNVPVSVPRVATGDKAAS